MSRCSFLLAQYICSRQSSFTHLASREKSAVDLSNQPSTRENATHALYGAKVEDRWRTSHRNLAKIIAIIDEENCEAKQRRWTIKVEIIYEIHNFDFHPNSNNNLLF